MCQCLLLFKLVQCLLRINESWSVDSHGSNIYWARSGWEEKHHNDRGANNSNPRVKLGATSVIRGAWWRLPTRVAQPLVPAQGRAGWDFNVFLPQKAPPSGPALALQHYALLFLNISMSKTQRLSMVEFAGCRTGRTDRVLYGIWGIP